MNNIVNENLAQASRGGIPGTYPLVRSFVGLRFQGEYLGLRDGVIDERPLWPMVSYHSIMSQIDNNIVLRCTSVCVLVISQQLFTV